MRGEMKSKSLSAFEQMFAMLKGPIGGMSSGQIFEKAKGVQETNNEKVTESTLDLISNLANESFGDSIQEIVQTRYYLQEEPQGRIIFRNDTRRAWLRGMEIPLKVVSTRREAENYVKSDSFINNHGMVIVLVIDGWISESAFRKMFAVQLDKVQKVLENPF